MAQAQIQVGNTGAALRVQNLRKEFQIKTGFMQTKALVAVNDISFAIPRGGGLALVGESGCGKSTAARCILQLEKVTGGEIVMEGRKMTGLNSKELKDARSKIQMVFQDPSDSLNPRFSVRKMMMEVLKRYTALDYSGRVERMMEILSQVGLPANSVDKYPHEFSGGQQQRIGMARAWATGAKIFVLDEPTSALDTSIQGQILELLVDLQKQQDFTYLFITHNLSVIQYLCEETAVMYLGKIVEKGKTERILADPIHPYTRALISSILVPDPLKRLSKREKLQGEVPSPLNLPAGCFLRGRCRYAEEGCKKVDMSLIDYGGGHFSACMKSAGFMV